MKGILGPLIVLGLWSVQGPPVPQDAGPRELALVAGPGVSYSGLTLDQVRELFRGDRQYWTPDLPVVLLMPAHGSREYAIVLRSVYQMSESQYRRHWIARIFRAEAVAPPKTVQTREAANELIGSVPGALAFIEAGRVRPGQRVLSVDGRRPGDAGYSVR